MKFGLHYGPRNGREPTVVNNNINQKVEQEQIERLTQRRAASMGGGGHGKKPVVFRTGR